MNNALDILCITKACEFLLLPDPIGAKTVHIDQYLRLKVGEPYRLATRYTPVRNEYGGYSVTEMILLINELANKFRAAYDMGYIEALKEYKRGSSMEN